MIVTIEPEIQDRILDILPDDGHVALDLMAQLTANMLLSVDGASYDKYIEMLNRHLNAYKGN